jgi:hypothetical protein
MNAADIIKTTLSTYQVAEHYGFRPNKTGFIRCPFHPENTPSLKIYKEPGRGWYCFGCGQGGSVITFVTLLFKITPYEAMQQLVYDFNLNLNIEPMSVRTFRKRNKTTEKLKKLELWENDYRNNLISDIRHLEKTISDNKPFSEPWCSAIRELEIKDYHWQLLLLGTVKDKAYLYRQVSEVKRHCKKIVPK